MTVLLLLAPALLLALLLALGRYPGSGALARVLERRRRPRGGVLLALALAGRAPPVAVA